MKKILASAAVLCLLFSTTAFAEAERGFVSATATANKELSPDTAEISIAVVTSDIKSMQTATTKNKELSDKLYEAMKTLITPANGDWVKTSDFSAQPVYTYSSGKRNFDKYEVSNRIIVHTKSIDKASTIIDKAIALGATNIDNLNFTLSSYEKECDALLATATSKTKVRADILAKAAGTQVTGTKSINASCNTSGVSQRIMYNMMAKSAVADSEAAMGGTPIETGLIKIYANVNASYFVK